MGAVNAVSISVLISPLAMTGTTTCLAMAPEERATQFTASMTESLRACEMMSPSNSPPIGKK
jgi:hypothetical protein